MREIPIVETNLSQGIPTIGVAGTGRMGTALATRLLETGHPVAVWNRTRERTKALADAGAIVAPTPAGLVAGSGFIITILRDSEAVEATYREPDGLLDGDVKGRQFIEMSTVPPQTQQTLESDVKERGGWLIDCPVGGSVGPALAGRLFGFVGGDEGDVMRSRPLLDLLCRRVEHVGPVGAGVSVKLAIQLPLHVYWQVMGEALTLCSPLDLDPERLLDILSDTPGAPNALKERAPSIVATLRGEESGPVSFDIDAIRKDLRMMIDEITRLGGQAPLTEAALVRFDEASKAGLGGESAVALTKP